MNIDKLIDAIGLIEDETVKEAKETSGKTIRFPFKKLAAVAAALLVCIGSVPALAAANVAPAYDLLYNISPALAQRLKPVQESCVDQGIQMEVGAAYIHGDTAEVMICFKDLEGNRIDETVDLFDSYVIRNSSDCVCSCEFLNYEEKTGVATFLVSITQMREKDFTGDKVTVSVSKLLTQKKTYTGTLPEINLSTASQTPDTQAEVRIHGRGGSNLDMAEGLSFLMPEETPLGVPINGVSVTGIGYVDGMLHVQVCYEDTSNTDNHGYIWLQGPDRKLVSSEFNINFFDEDFCDSYNEFVFDIPYEELGNYQIYGDFTVNGQLIEGDWQVTFPMNKAQ